MPDCVSNPMSNSDFTIELDSMDRDAWTRCLAQFDDASIYQTWSFAATHRRGRSVSHLLLKAGPEIVAGCQVRLRRLPWLNLQIADLQWGPLCVRHGQLPEPAILFQFIQAAREEYGRKRGCFLRIWPHATGQRKEHVGRALAEAGFTENLLERPYRTLMLDLSPSLEELRKNLLQKWRNCLNKAERNELVVVEGASDELFRVFQELAANMRERKHLGVSVDYEEYRRIQQDLPDAAKMQIMVCHHAGEPVAAAICSALGNTAIYLLGATGQKGLGLNGSYLLQWRMIQWMKSRGIRYYDLGAFNPELNPTVYHFKLGVAGKNGWEETFLRGYLGTFNWRGRLAAAVVRWTNRLRRSD